MEVLVFRDLPSVEACLVQHQRATFTHFVTYNRNKSFGDHDFIPNVWRGRMHYWSHCGKVGVPIEYDGVPFMHVGRWSLVCHQGRDIGARNKLKYQEKKRRLEHDGSLPSSTSRKSSTKKVNCPAEIYVSHVVKYPQFKVPSKLLSENSLPTEQIRRSLKEKIRSKHKFNPSKVERAHYYYVRLPLPSDHVGHPFVAQHVAANTGNCIPQATNVVVSNTSTLDRRKVNKNRDKHRRTREPMDERVAARLTELIKAGYCSTVSIRAELSKFVIQELFEGEPPPPAMFRRYNPTSRDILNAMARVKQEAFAFRCAELRSHCSSALSTITTSLPSINDEVLLANLYKQLAQMSKQCSVGGTGEEQPDFSVSLHQLQSDDSSAYQVVTVIEDLPSNSGRVKRNASEAEITNGTIVYSSGIRRNVSDEQNAMDIVSHSVIKLEEVTPAHLVNDDNLFNSYRLQPDDTGTPAVHSVNNITPVEHRIGITPVSHTINDVPTAHSINITPVLQTTKNTTPVAHSVINTTTPDSQTINLNTSPISHTINSSTAVAQHAMDSNCSKRDGPAASSSMPCAVTDAPLLGASSGGTDHMFSSLTPFTELHYRLHS